MKTKTKKSFIWESVRECSCFFIIFFAYELHAQRDWKLYGGKATSGVMLPRGTTENKCSWLSIEPAYFSATAGKEGRVTHGKSAQTTHLKNHNITNDSYACLKMRWQTFLFFFFKQKWNIKKN